MMIERVFQRARLKQTYCLEVLATPRERFCKKWPELWKNQSWIIHQDNAPARNVLSTKSYLAARGIPILKLALYSLYLAPCDFLIFLKIKYTVKKTLLDSGWGKKTLLDSGREKTKIGKAPKFSDIECMTSSTALVNEKNEWKGIWWGVASTLKGSIRS